MHYEGAGHAILGSKQVTDAQPSMFSWGSLALPCPLLRAVSKHHNRALVFFIYLATCVAAPLYSPGSQPGTHKQNLTLSC